MKYIKSILIITIVCAANMAIAQKGKIYPSSNPLPRFSQGILQNYIHKHVVYPEQAKQQKIEGKVVMGFVVEVDGKIGNVTIVKSSNKVFNDAAIHCIKTLPEFKPGLIDGKPVRVQMYVAVPFSLKPLPEQKEEPIIEELIATPDVEVVEGDQNGVDDIMVAPPDEPPPPPSETSSVEPAEVFTFVEQMPEFPGDLNEYLRKYLIYPADAREKGIQGKVIVQFIIESNGFISGVKILRGNASALNDEALRVVKAMPNWKPGKQNGRAVAVRYTLPITFALK